MAFINFLWHLHQPAYRTADDVSHAPWVLLHAGGAYSTLARAIETSGGRGQTINIVPTLLEQLLAYRDGRAIDPVSTSLVTPTRDLSSEQRRTVTTWSRHLSPRQLGRSPRLQELHGRPVADLGSTELRDLQVLTILAHAGEWAWRDEELSQLNARGRNFSPSDLAQVAEWLRTQPDRLITLWLRLAHQEGVEISTSPYAHPIMPLLIDSSIVEASWAPDSGPEVPDFRHREDAERQLREGLRYMEDAGFSPAGCWPPEGAVSCAAIEVYAAAGIQWLVTDEGILEKSLAEPVRRDGVASPALYRPWRTQGPSPVLFFRDRQLSDLIGFEYGNWHDEGVAAIDLVSRLRGLAATLPTDASIVIALDGENAWSHYAEGGGRFLETLMGLINETTPELVPANLDTLSCRLEPDTLPRLHPGSWINAIFATWIGHPEKTAAWKLLGKVRDALPNTDLPPSMLLAEGSDWFWWLGEDNPTALAPLYDRIFRTHLADACNQAGIDPPDDLDRPLKKAD